MRSQEKALDELRAESEELYQAAIQPDELLLPITIKGPAYTPPIKNYDVPAEYLFSLEPTTTIIPSYTPFPFYLSLILVDEFELIPFLCMFLLFIVHFL